MSNELTTTDQETAAFELMQRAAKMMAASSLVPKEFQGNIANCAIGINIAKRLGADPFMVVQNIDIIHGRPSFRATFLIAMVNASGRFTPLQFRMEGEGQNRSCVAYCNIKATGEHVEGPQITMAMAKAEGWSTKSGSKWITMPELMLRYRAAAFFARIYAPDITLGMHTSEEMQDVAATERQAKGREVADMPPLFIAQKTKRDEFWEKCYSYEMDSDAVMGILKANDMTDDESTAAEMLKPEQWQKLTELYAKESK